jgi:hypothetical protein
VIAYRIVESIDEDNRVERARVENVLAGRAADEPGDDWGTITMDQAMMELRDQ